MSHSTLKVFFAANPHIALAYSGGVDSAYLLYAAASLGADVRAYYVKSAFQPGFEFNEAKELAEKLHVPMQVIELDVLSCPEVTSNPANRCYHCKKLIMSAIKSAAGADGYSLIIDGTNYSDDLSDRPGFKALSEEGVLSPLRICGLTKADIRRLSKEAGLPTWDKPAYACLATRVPTGEKISAAKLYIIEKSEDILFSLGFSDFRVRLRGDCALLQFCAEQYDEAEARLEEIKNLLSPYFRRVELDSIRRKKSL